MRSCQQMRYPGWINEAADKTCSVSIRRDGTELSKIWATTHEEALQRAQNMAQLQRLHGVEFVSNA